MASDNDGHRIGVVLADGQSFNIIWLPKKVQVLPVRRENDAALVRRGEAK